MKNLITLFLVCALVLLFGCGHSDPQPSSTSPSTPREEPVVQPSARVWLERAAAEAAKISGRSAGVYDDIACLYAKIGDFDSAVFYAGHLQEGDKKDFLRKHIAEAQARALQFEAAEATVQTICDPRLVQRAWLFIAKQQAQAGRYDEAAKYAGRLSDPLVCQRTEWEIRRARAGAKPEELARVLREEAVAASAVEKDSPREGWIEDVVEAQMAAGFWDDAMDTAKKAKRNWTRNIMLVRLGEEMADSGLINKAKAAAVAIDEKDETYRGWRIGVLCAVALAQYRMGDKSGYVATFEDLDKLLKGLDGAFFVLQVAETGAKIGLFDRSRDMLRNMKNTEWEDGAHRVCSFCFVAKEAARQDKQSHMDAALMEALAAMRDIDPENQDWRDSYELCAFDCLVCAMEELDAGEEVFKAARELATGYGEPYVGMLQACIARLEIKAGNIQKALEIAKAIEDDASACHALCAVARAQAAAPGNGSPAHSLCTAYSRIEDDDRSMADQERMGWERVGVVEVCMELGLYGQAVNIAFDCYDESYGYHAGVFAMISQALTQEGRNAEAEKIYAALVGESPDICARFCIGAARGLAGERLTDWTPWR